MKDGHHSVIDQNNRRKKRTKRKSENHVKTSARIIALICLAAGKMRTGQDRHGPDKNIPPGAREKRKRNMTRNILCLVVLTILAAAVSLHAEPTPSAERTPSKNAKSQRPPGKTSAIVPAPRLVEGWNYVNREWIHSDGYKYVNRQVVRTAAQTHKRPPKPPTKALLDSVKIKPTPTPDPNSAAAKAAERERNLRPRPASQTGTHL